ncbi:hypothetical protein [Lacipirellula limnantheis]|uniref:Uncharacterized protein n=1 Tax=Lacipirellula limnantheis TaxID=2528024 RepID=A0A517U0C7_9BACT|nr:hypothetical protein [Lacipirellula limnantheis]QDT74053.1 hypothetical protein I41_32470 [Lacipirellula limnantheis]
MQLFHSIGDRFRLSLEDGWHWVQSLNTQEWFLLLGFCAAAGFCCMRGTGSRSNY